MDESESLKNRVPNRFLYWFAAAVFAFFGVYYLWTQHRAHVLQYWPLALFLLCPLMHLFGGHRGHCKHDHGEKKKDEGGEHHA